jgi:hypothetical protein
MRAMSYWQFCEQVDGWIAGNVKDADKGISTEEEDELWALVKAG